ncbi:helix-turn-helix domain-containing protein [Pseudomonas allii]|uniref:helix-turn-helix domain-containing protein n=1 Tax=Pseudomonas allii TaxID=2740531 RepID=UPI001F04556E|nr:helix-turn-helix domain-containing protein [Pseudomonas allii]
MNSLRRLLAVFDLFRPDQPVIDVDIICRELGYTPATAYRYLRELGDAGLLKRLPGLMRWARALSRWSN